MSNPDMLGELAKKSADHEYYTRIPPGYKAGKTKYIIITGSVMSGLGKGIFSSSLGRLLEDQGLTCSPLKFDGYLNGDAGTLNPYRHGEVFVLDDGLECDMDLGTYERFLNKNITRNNYLTGGKIFSQILDRERKGKYLGRDVQFIPHVTGEIKRFMRDLAVSTNADVVLIEVGGTVGDIENQYFIEAMRQLVYEEGKNNTCVVNVTYVLEPGFLGEQKSKAAQLGIRRLMELGIQPDVIACRATNPVTEKVREKISVYSNVPFENVVSVHDTESIYLIPGHLAKSQIDKRIMDLLSLTPKKPIDTSAWENMVKRLKNPHKEVTIGITGKYTGLRDSYASILKAMEHAGAENDATVFVKWIETTDVENGKISAAEALKDVDGIIVPGGFGKRGAEGKIACIKYAREHNMPYLGLCLGFQMALIEFARNVCTIEDANSTEFDPDCKNPVIDLLPEQKKIEGLGGNMRLGGRDIKVKADTMAWELYGKKESIRERFRHRYECNPEYIETLEKNGLVFSGRAPNVPIMQILELPANKFHIGTQFHPEFTSRPLSPNPLYVGLIKACLK